MKSLDHYVEAEDFKTKRPSLLVFNKVIADLFKERFLFSCGVGLIVLGTIATVYEPKLFGRAIDEAILPKNISLLHAFVVAYFTLMAIRIGTLIAQTYLFSVLAQRMMQRLRLKVFAHLQNLPLSTFDITPVGRLITRITTDTSAMSDMFSNGFVTMLGNILNILGTILALILVNRRLGLISISIFPVLILFAAKFSKRLILNYRNARMRISSLNAFLAENILGMKVVHLFNREKDHLERFAAVNESYCDAQVGAVKVYAYFQPLITWCSGIGVALVLAFGGKWALQGTIKPGELVAVITYVLALFQPVREVVDRWTIFLSGMTSAERIYGLLEWKTEMSAEESARPLVDEKPGVGAGEIVFENVWFAYGGEDWVLRDFSLTIRAGERVGIVGHTGAGKSTLAGLLLRFYQPQRGRILIDGQSIQEIDRRVLRKMIGLVHQDVFLFSGSIEENLSFWKGWDQVELPGSERREGPRLDTSLLSKRSLEALKKLEFSQSLLLPLDERGSNLSGGERQILAFVRTLEADPQIWILDEATANVDSRTEERIGHELNEARKGKTLLVIAHRLSTIRDADQILVLHKGVLVEKGNHSALIRAGGAYAKLYQYQSALEAAPGLQGTL